MLRIVEAIPTGSAAKLRREPLPARRLLVLGSGSVARAFIPLLRRHFALQTGQVMLLSPESAFSGLADGHRVSPLPTLLTRETHPSVLTSLLESGDCLVNLALGVGSADLIAWCRRRGVVYLDTNLEPWGSNYHAVHAERSRVLSQGQGSGPTAVIAHGANPGLVSHFAKQAMAELAAMVASDWAFGQDVAAQWSSIAHRLGLRMVMVTEWDSQRGARPVAAGEFANTWSPRGLFSELQQPAELCWGDHRTDAAFRRGFQASRGAEAVLPGSAGEWELRSWSPGIGEFTGYPLAHHECFSLGALFAASPCSRRPTVCYVYRPCPAADHAARALRAAGATPPTNWRLLDRDLIDGTNELGVLLLTRDGGYWFGSTLELSEAREIAPDCNATTLQVAAGVLGALVWALENPQRGMVEAEDMDQAKVLEVAAPYLGRLRGLATDWRPNPAPCGEAGPHFGDLVVRRPGGAA